MPLISLACSHVPCVVCAGERIALSQQLLEAQGAALSSAAELDAMHSRSETQATTMEMLEQRFNRLRSQLQARVFPVIV